ncbi:MAG: hypothetical protein M3503_05535 [Actinomycetota bacterium]|nr:hypothetical protein [Actinomycetota bacterium]
MQVPRRHAPLLVGLLMTAACGGGGDDGGGPDERAAATTSSEEPTSTSSTATSSTTTTAAPADPTVVPDDPAAIDEAYVEAVLREHNRVIGDALRLQLQGADLKEIVDRYNAIYVPEVADGLLSSVLQPSEEILASLKDPPGDQVTDVVGLLEVTAQCVEAEVLIDLSQVLTSAPAASSDTVVIRRVTETSALNKTAWVSEGVIPGTDTGIEGC